MDVNDLKSNKLTSFSKYLSFKSTKLKLPWYLNRKTLAFSLKMFKELTKEIAVGAFYFPDEHLDKFNLRHNIKPVANQIRDMK
jgi:hypothetical protein